MRYLYENELRKYLDESKEEILAHARTLVTSENATSHHMANELSSMLRGVRRYDEATEVALMMYEMKPSLDSLNLYFVAAADQGDIGRIQTLSRQTDTFLRSEGLGYQKHLFATWLKAANKIQDDEMFNYVYSQIPADEKEKNSYIIAQYYVFKNRRSQYEDVCKHYDRLEPHIQNSMFVKRYYENARRRMGFYVPSPMDVTKAMANTGVQPVVQPQDAAEEDQEKRIFLVYGGDPGELKVIETLLKVSNVPCIILSQEDKTGQSIIEAFERHASKADLAVVLCTPEDEMKNGKWYVRQNVIFECGFFMAKLGREKVVLLRQDKGKNLEIPSDFNALYSISMERGSWITELGIALKTAGFSVPF